MNVIEIENLTKKYKQLKAPALNDFSLTVKKGEILGLLGPNGSGKTTTINCILGLLKYDEGSIRVMGEELKPDSYELKRNIGVVFQEVAVFDELTVYENVNYFCGLYIKDKNIRKCYVEEAIELVGLTEFKKFYPKKLSGGLLRRLNIACGIAHKPNLIFLDEPTVAVDPQSRNNILESLKKLNKAGVTIIYTTHYMEEVEILCDRIVIIDKGKVIANGTKEELKILASIGEKVTIEIENLSDKNLKEIKNLKDINSATYNGTSLNIIYKKGNHTIGNLIDYFNDKKIRYNKIFSELPSLNDVFLELTGKELRD